MGSEKTGQMNVAEVGAEARVDDHDTVEAYNLGLHTHEAFANGRIKSKPLSRV